MTFLEYILNQYLGTPTKVRGNGESEWPCPQCGHERFHTMPIKPQFKHRARCWRCDFRGDAADMIWEFHPDEPWGDRKERLAKLQEEWQVITSSGERGLPDHDEAVAVAVSELTETLGYYPPTSFLTPASYGLWALSLAARIADERGLSLRDMASMGAGVLLATKELNRAGGMSCQ